LQSQSTAYAQQILLVAQYISDHYVRPIPPAKIVEASLEGVFEAAREPLPSWVKADLSGAKDSNQLLHILTLARQQLGDREALRDRRALLISLRAIPRVLDPYCGVANLNDPRASGESTLAGVGLEFETTPLVVFAGNEFEAPQRGAHRTMDRGPARISVVHPGGPAQRAGIRPGDILTHIDGKAIDRLEGAELFSRLFSADSTNHSSLKLTLHRPNQREPLEVALAPTTFRVESVFGVGRRLDGSWDYLLDREHRIGYVRLGFIDQSSDSEMEEVMMGLKAQGMRGLILDLRGNPGGFVDPATNIAGMFIKSGTIAVIDDRTEGKQPYTINNGTGILQAIPTIVIIDAQTRGGGEMIAAVLQDHHVAKIAGERSFGKGSVQKTRSFLDRRNGVVPGLESVQFKLTTGTFTRPSGKNLHRFPDSKLGDDWGIRPDAGYYFPVPPDVAKQVKEWMQLQVLRPGRCRDPLPLDDPEHDPLRRFAWRKLVKQLSPKQDSR
jgi:C-terminal peptidase prc